MTATDTDSTRPPTDRVLSDTSSGAGTGTNFVLNTRPLKSLRAVLAKTMGK